MYHEKKKENHSYNWPDYILQYVFILRFYLIPFKYHVI